MRVLVPYAATSPKTRLGPVLAADERTAFSRSMLADVIDALTESGNDPEVLATDPIDLDVPLTVDDRPLTDAVNAKLAASTPAMVVMADLPLVTTTALARLREAPGEVVLAPGRAGGTNAFVARHPAFRVDYHGTSFLDHLGIAREVGATVSVIDSYRLAVDIDEPADLIEVLVHGEGAAATWLREAGFRVDRSGERVSVVREDGT